MLGKMKTRFQSARPWEFVVLGLGLNLRPKAILLAVTAGALISVQEPPLLPGSFARSRLRRCHPVSCRRADRRMAALPGAGRSAADRHLHVDAAERPTIAAVATLAIGVFIVGYTFVQL